MDKRSSADEQERDVDVQVAPAFAGAASEERLRQVAEAVLRHEGSHDQVTVVVTDDVGIQELNCDFLGIDAPTDVLSFGAQEATGPFVFAPEAGNYLGDVIVSYPRAAAQAAEQGHPAGRELDLLVVHGLLHLLGYDHATEAEQAIMWARQDEILNTLSKHNNRAGI
jgi:probable rRNA maturation factor